jgi:hypothetical protein
MDIKNLSIEPLGKLHSWLPHGLHADKVVFLPDAFDSPHWRRRCRGESTVDRGER